MNSIGHTGVDRLLHLPASLCPVLFTARNSDRVNYGEAGFHKFRDEIWSDKFKSLGLAPRSRAHTRELTVARTSASSSYRAFH